jgi:TonB family protein
VFNSNGAALSAIPRIADAFTLPELQVGENASLAVPAPIHWQGIILGVYLTGAILLLLRMILGIVRVLLLRRKGKKGEFTGYTLVRIPDKIAPFSFFRTIYLNSDHLNDSDKKYIIDHELIHIRQLHSYDNLLIESCLALFWFNPFMWLLKSAMRDTHEYLADSGVLMDSANSSGYQSLLLSQITGSLPMVITSSFNSTLKNRIKMMCKNKSSLFAKYKPLLIVPVLTGLVLLFACEEKSADPLEEEYAFDEIAPEADASTAVEEEEVFFIVEEMPTFAGDDPAIEFRKYIAQNLQYPEIASENGISGRVIIQFAVDSHGKVVDAIVVRGVDDALDKEALRLVNSSPDWTPGKQKGKPVKVLFTFPINFVLP